MDEVEVIDGMVWLTQPDAYGCDATNAWYPAYARELGAALIAAADEAEKQSQEGESSMSHPDVHITTRVRRP